MARALLIALLPPPLAVHAVCGGAAAPPAERAAALLRRMTLDEKIVMVHGAPGNSVPVIGAAFPYSATVPGNARLGIPELTLTDGPAGFRDLRHIGTSTQFPSPLSVAATWNTTAAGEYGSAMGREFAGKGANVQLGPGVNVARVPHNGRNFEYLSGEDPFLGAAMVQPVVRGIQAQGVIANVKHYINNNQETQRMSINEVVDERTRMEIYQPPFTAAVEAGVLSAMCSYNRINGAHACESSQTLNTELKGIAGFKGWVMSDWTATRSTVAAALNGLDQEMPGQVHFGAELKACVLNGTVPAAVLDDKVLRILSAMYTVGLFDRPRSGSVAANVTSAEHAGLARRLAAEGVVLLKNEAGALPLPAALRKIVVIGTQAALPVSGGLGSGMVVGPYVSSLLDAVTAVVGPAAVEYYDGGDASAAVAAAAAADAAVVIGGTTSSEGFDRRTIELYPHIAALISAVGRAQRRTVAVAVAPGALVMPWADDVAAAVVSFLPGQEEGRALADVLFGRVNPSGRLPLSMPRGDNDLNLTAAQWPGVDGTATYSERLEVGYRWYAAHGAAPRFAFGHGLSYTRFAFSAAAVAGRTASFTVTNAGAAPGAVTPQLYLRFPAASGEPPLQLKGFRKLALAAGASARVTITLTPRDLSVWSTAAHKWEEQHGTFGVLIGDSAADIRLQAELRN